MKFRRAAVAGLAAVLLAGGCGGGADPAERDLTIAGGVRGGVYIRYGAGLAAVVGSEEPWLRSGVLTTNGSVHNVALLRAGCADVAFVAADVAAVAHAEDEQSAPEEGRRMVALARLYDEYVQLVTRADGPVRSLADLGTPGVRVSLGAPGSGTAVIARRLIETAGLQVAGDPPTPPVPDLRDCPRADRSAAGSAAPSAPPGPDPCQAAEPVPAPSAEPSARAAPAAGEVRDLGLNLGRSAARLAVGALDAFFWSGGLPACPIRELAAAIPIRLVDLGAEAAALAADKAYADFYTPTTIPASAYGLSGPVRTIAVPNYLLALRGLDPAVAYAVTRALFAGGPRLAAYAADARRLDIRSALTTRPLALHPEAVRYYREVHGG